MNPVQTNMFPSFTQIVTCNYCHVAPAAGWVTEVIDGEETARSACLECAKKEGIEVSGEVVGHAEL